MKDYDRTDIDDVQFPKMEDVDTSAEGLSDMRVRARQKDF